jgi:hypothetical protein
VARTRLSGTWRSPSGLDRRAAAFQSMHDSSRLRCIQVPTVQLFERSDVQVCSCSRPGFGRTFCHTARPLLRVAAVNGVVKPGGSQGWTVAAARLATLTSRAQQGVLVLLAHLPLLAAEFLQPPLAALLPLFLPNPSICHLVFAQNGSRSALCPPLRRLPLQVDTRAKLRVRRAQASAGHGRIPIAGSLRPRMEPRLAPTRRV